MVTPHLGWSGCLLSSDLLARRLLGRWLLCWQLRFDGRRETVH